MLLARWGEAATASAGNARNQEITSEQRHQPRNSFTAVVCEDERVFGPELVSV